MLRHVTNRRSVAQLLPMRCNSVRVCRTFVDQRGPVEANAGTFVEFGDIKVPLNVPKNPELVPGGNLHYWGKDLDNAPQEVIGHLRWMAQKSLLGQDIFLTGPPTSNRRRLILSLAELCGWECEYLMITKDTTEADLKQRREIVGDSVVWCDSAPVRAAINGRILIIDGMENAERNVLPTINNLLENREMMLEDGRFLMKGETIEKLHKNDIGASTPSLSLSARLIPVHPSFRVVALGLPVPPYHGRVLDPPLRSRFQSRFIDELSLGDALNCVNTSGFNTAAGASESLKAVAGVYEGLRTMRGEAIRDGAGAAAVPSFSLDGLRHSLNVMRTFPVVSVSSALSRSIPMGYAWRPPAELGAEVPTSMGSALSHKHKTMLQTLVEKVRALPVVDGATAKVRKSVSQAQLLTSFQQRALDEMTQDLSVSRNVCLLGGKGSGKSFVLQELASIAEQEMFVFPVYQEMSGRDLLQRRGTSTEGSTSVAQAHNASSLWLDSPLVKAARTGAVCVLDGVDRIDPQALLAIRTLISSPTFLAPEPEFGFEGGSEGREIDLPSGERMQVHEKFRLIALGAPPAKSEDARARYLNSDLNLSFHLVPDVTPSDIERVLRSHTAQSNASAKLDKATAETISQADNQLMVAIRALYKSSHKAHQELRPSLRHAQRVQATLRTMLCNSAEPVSMEEISVLVHSKLSQALLVRFLSAAASVQFDAAMESAGIGPTASPGNKFLKFMKKDKSVKAADRTVAIDYDANEVTIGAVTVPRRKCALPELVPQPLFHANASHLQVLESLLLSYKASYETDEKAILLIGNQGVGKNKLVDRLLQVLNAEREYIQLHRDTTIQSLTLIPLLELGQLTYQDSPLVRAAQTGRILVCDEVDKAPLEVICMLKGLIGDGELVLHDGRRLLSMARARRDFDRTANSEAASTGAEFDTYCRAHQIVPMHPDFRIFVLANRPGHPFQGNAFFRECGDLFSCHVIDNLDVQSEVELLRAFAPSVDNKLIGRIAETFAELRGLNDSGVLNYPFSAREAVAIVKHLQAYPQDGVEAAVEDILGFDGMNPQVRTVIAEVFRKRGFHITADAPAVAFSAASPMRIKGGRGRDGESRGSTPRTNSNMPKHGKHDADNKPHVGGNTWAGGSGGSDTAGLGGRGGPYRLQDPGNHPVHQVSDEDKAAVSKESREAAAAMAKQAFEERLREISMGKNDYAVFQQYRSNISLQVAQLKEILNDITSRGKERVWLRNQSQGNLDDSKLVDGLSGERLVFKRRGYSDNALADLTAAHSDDGPVPKKRIQFVVDVSGSMMRFNGMDRRLERMLEASLLIMEALPRRGPPSSDSDGEDTAGSNSNSNAELAELLEFSISGHSGDTADELFVDFPSDQEETGSIADKVTDLFTTRRDRQKGKRPRIPRGVLNERDKMSVMEKMVAHAQFCMPGDHTLQATEIAIDRLLEGVEEGDNTQRMVIVLSDANFNRYDIDPADVSRIMRKSDKVKVHMILIASLRDEAESVARALPLGYAHLCSESSDLPSILRSILVSSFDS